MPPAGIPKFSGILPPICVSLGLSQTSYYVLTSFRNCISLTFHLLARALTAERTVIGRLVIVLPDMIIILQIRSFSAFKTVVIGITNEYGQRHVFSLLAFGW